MWCETFRYFMGASHVCCYLLHLLQYAIYTTFGLEQVLSRCMQYFLPVALKFRYDWLPKKLSHNVSQIMFILYGLPRTNKSLKFGHHLLSTSMEQYGKMLWRNSEFLIKWNWRLIIWDILRPRGLNIAINMTLFSKDFSTFLSTSCLGIEDIFKFKLNLSCFGFFNVNLTELKNFRAIFSFD